MTITVIAEGVESTLKGDLKGIGGVSLKNSQEGVVIPAVAVRGDIYFRKGNDVIRLDDFLQVIRQGYIMSSRLEPGFDWDGFDEAGDDQLPPEQVATNALAKASRGRKKASPLKALSRAFGF